MSSPALHLNTSNKYTANKVLSLLQGKCPRCQNGKVFKYNALSLQRFTDMNADCTVCGLHFEIEPGFFWWYVGIICGTVILCTTLLYRYSRIMMLYLFSSVQFDEKLAAKSNEK